MAAVELPTLVRVGRPEGSLLDIPKLAQPSQVHIERLDLAWASHQMPDFRDTLSNRHVRDLGRGQTTTDHQQVGLLFSLELCRDDGIRELLDLHGVTHLWATLLRIDARDAWSIGRPYCKDNYPSMVHSVVGPKCENLIYVRDVANVTIFDILDLFLLDQTIAEAVPIDYAFAMF